MNYRTRIPPPVLLRRRSVVAVEMATALSDATNNAAFRDAHSNALRRFADDADGRRAALHDAGGFGFTTTLVVGARRSDARGDDAMVRCDVRATPRMRRRG
jgi:hypothetical protein